MYLPMYSFDLLVTQHNILCVHIIDLQVNLIIRLSLGSMEADRVISKPC